MGDEAIQAAIDAGFDLNLIEINLSLTPEERIAYHQSALDLCFALEEARKLRDEVTK